MTKPADATMKLPPEKNMKSAQHHWWPRSLSRFWADDQGGVHRLTWDGKVSRAQPASFGALTNAHHVKLADVPTVWDETFEPQFGSADMAFPSLVDWLQSLESIQPATGLLFGQRTKPQDATDERLRTCIDCLISLIVRSPRFRSSIRTTVAHYRSRIGIPDGESDNSLVELNQRDSQKRFRDAITGRGKLSVLVSHDAEFIFGDGFFHNFVSSASAPWHPRILVPLTPKISVFYARPLSFPSEPRLTTISLLPEEVRFLNDTIQVYSRDELFYRMEKPSLLDEFMRHEFLEYEHNDHPAIACLEQVATQTTFPPRTTADQR